MKHFASQAAFLLLFFSLLAQQIVAQEKAEKKNKLYFYWGYNWDAYTKSNIRFQGVDYDFTLSKVAAKHRPSAFSTDLYFNPKRLTIPQYNFRMGYFLNEHWDLSFGIDHMKYVVQQNQEVGIDGYIHTGESAYDGDYFQDNVLITNGFLYFEHTDGLNYINSELRYHSTAFEKNMISVSAIGGIGLGIVYPKTNTTLLRKERYDQFHLAGIGTNSVLGLNCTFWEVFFLQSEIKGGYIFLPDIRTTHSVADKASQTFFFAELNAVFGAIIKF